MDCHLNISFTLWLVIYLLPPSIAQPVMQTFYKRKAGFKFNNITANDLCLARPCDGSIRMCAVLCSMSVDCTSFTLDSSTKRCLKNVKDLYTFGASFTASGSEDYVGKVQSDVTDGDWILIFRGQSGNGEAVSTAWQDTGRVTSLTGLDPDSVSKEGVPGSSHYRSKWIDSWPSSDIEQVKFSLYKAGIEVVYLTFNAAGTTNTDWFAESGLIDSSFTDILSAGGITRFSFQGQMLRRFLITNTGMVFNCNQEAWLMVEDGSDNGCSWTGTSGLPRFLYSSTGAMANFNTPGNVEIADVLAVFIKMKTT